MTCSSCNKNTGSSQRYVNSFQAYNPPKQTNATFAQNPQPLTQWTMRGGQKPAYSSDFSSTNGRKELENVYGVNVNAKSNNTEMQQNDAKSRNKNKTK